MKIGLCAVLALPLAGIAATAGCRKKAAPPRVSRTVVTVTVTGSVDAEGNFEKGGFVVAGQQIDGKDAAGLTAALEAQRSAATARPGGILVRVLIYPATPYGVVRRIIAAARKAEIEHLTLACIEEDAPRPSGIAFTSPAPASASQAVEVRIWPKPGTEEALYRVAGVAETLPAAGVMRASLASRKAASGATSVLFRPADGVTAGVVAEAMTEAMRAGFEAVSFTGEAMLDEAPEPPKVAAAPPPPDDDEPVPTGPRPPSSFSGAGGEAYNVVYMIDRSGSMVAGFDQVRGELLKSIAALDGRQYFHVIFFGGRRPQENPARKLVPATEANKQAARAFIETIASSGVTQPIPAVNRAFDVLLKARKSRPGKLIYMLTDGDFTGEMRFTDNEAVLAAIRSRNADKKAVIHTLLYGKRSAEGEKVLKAIAEENGGKYLFVKRPE